MTDMELAQKWMKEGNYTCVACQKGRIYTDSRRGVRPLLDWLDDCVDLMGASVVDKVVGRGAAFLYRLLGVRSVYGGVMSVGAVKVLRAGGIETQWGTLAESIRDRSRTGMCPIERCTMATDDPEEALELIRAELSRLERK